MDIVKKLEKEIEMLQNYITFDELTSVLRRGIGEKYLEEDLKTRISVVIVFIDIDNFKYLNDNFGHPFGDSVLQLICQLLKEILNVEDYIIRWGGDEFVGVFPQSSINQVSQKIHQTLQDFNHFGHSFSYGFAISNSKDTANTIVNRADKEMYNQRYGNRL